MYLIFHCQGFWRRRRRPSRVLTPLLEVSVNMKWLNNRFLLLAYATVLTALVVIGCTSKEDPSEVLPLCNGHSCGDLMMVTTDTSSDGFQYLNPVMSPDGTRIAFTADWWALPSDPHLDEDRPYTTHRQIGIIPVLEGIEPVQSLSDEGAELVRVNDITLLIGGQFEHQRRCPGRRQGRSDLVRRPHPDLLADDRPRQSTLHGRHHESGQRRCPGALPGARRCDQRGTAVAAHGAVPLAGPRMADLHPLGGAPYRTPSRPAPAWHSTPCR